MRVPIPKSPADRRRTSPRRALSRALVVLLAFGLLAAACGDDDEPSTGDRKTIRIALDFFPNTNYAGIAAAIDKGYFEEQNLDVEIVPWAFTVTGILVENGNADLGIAYPPDTFREVALGNKVRTVAAILQVSNVSIIVPEDSPYRVAADLQNAATYGGFGTPHEGPIVTEFLKAVGDPNPDFTPVVLQGGPTEALISGDVDFSASFIGWLDIAARLAGTPMRVFPYREYIPEIVYPDVIFVASQDTIDSDANLLERALIALGKGYEAVAADPAEAANILIRVFPDLEQSRALVTESAVYRAPQYLDGNGNWGCVVESQFAGMAGLLDRSGLLVDAGGNAVARPSFDSFATNQLLPNC